MATLVLSAVGTIFGPLGSAVGALVGRQIDGALFGGRKREGPRLKELAITTSSYGQPIARQHGRMRVAGSIIWATELVESSETSGGKGKPKTTTYSYSTSFAVALSSRPIQSVGRIWADGNLLRGSAGDLKSPGTLRVYSGHGDQPLDPLIASAQGAACPAFRNCAYVVFEDLQLADFGNRIPALTFEVVADDGLLDAAILLEPAGDACSAAVPLTQLEGFEYPGGTLRQSLGVVDQLFPMVGRLGEDGLALVRGDTIDADPPLLGEASLGWEEGEGNLPAGIQQQRASSTDDVPTGVRYYEVDRDYQPGIQRSEGRQAQGDARTIDFPGAFAASGARRLIGQASERAAWRRERLHWRVAELDPAHSTGSTVRVPDRPGLWRIVSREWRERGIELELERIPPATAQVPAAEAGAIVNPLDEPPWPSWLRAFELPWDGFGDPNTPALYAAASAGGPGWRGAALFVARGEALEPLDSFGRKRSIAGATSAPLPPSASLRLEKSATMAVALLADDMELSDATPSQLARGANRLLVGREILQFARAQQTGPGQWQLSGLLRGRAGTEPDAQLGHPTGTGVTLLDGSLVALDPKLVAGIEGETIAAIGFADEEPVIAPVESAGATRTPPCPVHPRAVLFADGSLELGWARRARGMWSWSDGVEVPLVEERERYLVGAGAVSAPIRQWTVETPSLALAAGEVATLPPGTPIWVAQLGSFAASRALLLHTIP